MKNPRINEEFICRIWEDRTAWNELATTDGKSVEVLEFGVRNKDAGADYKNAKIKIDGVIYAGSVEIHRSTDDWLKHGHADNPKYNAVILNVALWKGKAKQVSTNERDNIPTVILSEYLNRSIHEIWRDVIGNPVTERIPSYPLSRDVPDEVKLRQIKKCAFERLEYKAERINERYSYLKNTVNLTAENAWEQTLFEHLCEALGYSKNKDNMLKLSSNAELIKLKDIIKDQYDCEIVLFGLAGFLEGDAKDEYHADMKNHWTEPRKIIKKEVIHVSEWNFFRLRPQNFPTLRIAAASVLLYNLIQGGVIKSLMKDFRQEGVKAAENMLSNIELPDYWKSHYNFGKESKVSNGVGTARSKEAALNVIVPLFYSYALEYKLESEKESIEDIYFKLGKSPANSLTDYMSEQLDVKIKTAADGQGLIHLHDFYCTRGRCQQCEISNYVHNIKPLKIILY